MITVEELKVGDLLKGRLGGVILLVNGFKEEETISGITKSVILVDTNFAKGATYIEPLDRVMHSQFDVIRDGKLYKCKEGRQWKD